MARKSKSRTSQNRQVAELEDSPESDFRSAVLAAAQAMPLCASAIRGLHMVITDNVPSMAVDKYFRCYVNPKFIDECKKLAEAVSPDNPCSVCGATKHHTLTYVAGVICHEAWHLLRTHLKRAKTQNILESQSGHLWAVATDMEINDGLLEVFGMPGVDLAHPLCLPPNQTEIDPDRDMPGILLPKIYKLPDGKLAEEYYHLLKDMQKEGQPGAGEGDQPYGDADHGSGVDGLEREYEAGEPGPDNKVTGLSEIEATMIRKEVAKKIQEASKTRGNVPGGWKRWADEELGQPKYDWRSELRKVVSHALHLIPGDRFRSYRRLSRRCASIGHAAILPSYHDAVPCVAIVQDTSGSMSNKQLKLALEETQGILRASQADVTYINCDAAVDKTQKIHNVRDIDLYGGGGTDMTVGIKAAEESYPSPDIIILFTDGYTPWPSKPLPKGKQLVVCLVGEEACDVNEPPPWAKVIKVVDELVSDVRAAS